jgi:oxygen-independent coproporphyrinogen-3 oxidase
MQKNPIRNLYIHTPFCASKCGYCAFYSIPGAKKAQRWEYLKKLKSDLEVSSDSCGDLHSVYIGGGTPTALDADELEYLFDSLRNNFHFADKSEISIECNPETLNDEKADVLSSFVNRVSLGVQSFKPHLRKILQRQGSVDNLLFALDALRTRGIENLGADLIYAIPGQTLQDWRNDLREAADLGLKHISAYALTMEEGSRLAREGGLSCFDDKLSEEMWDMTREILKEYGFARYEISNYSIDGCQCRHNMNVWHGEKYLGLGPAASSFDGEKRWTQPADLDLWLKNASSDFDILDELSRAREIFVMGLRTSGGWNWNSLETFFSAGEIDRLKKDCEKFLDESLMEMDSSSVKLSRKGLMLWDSIAAELI